MSFYAIETCRMERSEWRVLGPFQSIHEAREHIRADMADTFMDCDKSLRDMSEETPWSDPYIIVEERQTIEPVPSVKVLVKLKNRTPAPRPKRGKKGPTK